MQSNAAPALMAPDAASLLYVSDPSGGGVSFYSYPGGKRAGTIPNFYQPGGMCASAKTGNVFIADPSSARVRVFAHGGTKAVRTLSDTGYAPLSCAVDPSSGDLAVTSQVGPNKLGSLAIYTHATGKPKVYTNVNVPRVFYAAYDNAGNVYLDGETKKSAVVAAELAKGATSIKMVTLDQTIGAAGGVAWDGTNVAIGDVSAGVIYRFAISAGKGTKVGSTPLNGSAFVEQFCIPGTQVVAPDYINGVVRYYKYPAGGSAVKTISGFTGPIATTISP